MAMEKRKKDWEDLEEQKLKDRDSFHRNKRFIMKDRYINTKRWNQDVKNRDPLLSTYKLDKKMLITPAESIKTLKHSVTQANLHNRHKFKNPKRDAEYFKIEKTYVE